MNKSGFSLFETLVYIALFGLIAIFAYRLFVHNYQAIAHNQRKTASLMSVYAAFARLHADIQMADPLADSWQKKTESHLVIPSIKDKHISWFVEKNNLYRKQGKTKSLIAQQIQHFSIQVHYEGEYIKKITCALRGDSCDFIHTMRICNGLL